MMSMMHWATVGSRMLDFVVSTSASVTLPCGSIFQRMSRSPSMPGWLASALS
jgi:hypothetical protein